MEFKRTEPRASAEAREVRMCQLLNSKPLPGGLRDQRARFVGALEYLVDSGLMAERGL